MEWRASMRDSINPNQLCMTTMAARPETFALPQVTTVWDLEKKTIRRRNPTRKEEDIWAEFTVLKKIRRLFAKSSNITNEDNEAKQEMPTGIRIRMRIRIRIPLGVGIGEETKHANYQFHQ